MRICLQAGTVLVNLGYYKHNFLSVFWINLSNTASSLGKVFLIDELNALFKYCICSYVCILFMRLSQ